jgi:spore coat protein A
MSRLVTAPLAAFVDRLPVPRRLIAAEEDGLLTVRMRSGTHRFHRDLPESTIWGYDGTFPRSDGRGRTRPARDRRMSQ